MIDSHCHLDPSVWGTDADVDAVITRAGVAGVDRLMVIGAGYGFESAARALALARRHAQVRCAIGLHPHDAKDFTDARFADLLAMAEAPEVRALGEMGLDYHYDLSPRELQRVVFREQLRAARRLKKPVVIHDRESDGETLSILDQEQQWEHGVLYHCYTGDPMMMQEITARGGYISIPGIVTFKNAGAMTEVARTTPLDRLLIETDSPFLTPVPHRGKRNEPAFVGLVLAKIAELRGMRADELDARTTHNTLGFFAW